MSEKYNDENVKKILESEEIPERLEPENINKLLDEINAQEKRKKIRKKGIIRIVSVAAALAIAVGVTAHAMKPVYNKIPLISGTENSISQKAKLSSMKSANDYKDIYKYFTAAANLNNFKDAVFGLIGSKKNETFIYNGAAMEDGYAEYADDADTEYKYAGEGSIVGEESSSDTAVINSSYSEENSHSDTYSQEEGVLEADIVKTDGKHIVYTTDDTLYVTTVDKGKFIDPYKIKIKDLLKVTDDGMAVEYITIRDMYIYNSKLIILADYIKPTNDNENGNHIDIELDGCYYERTDLYNTCAAVLSIGDKLTLDGYFCQEGSYNDVRLMSDGYMYVISNSAKYLDVENTTDEDIEKYIPRYNSCGKKKYVPADNIMIPFEVLKEFYNYFSYINISGLDLNSEKSWEPADVKSIAGYSNTLYCSKDNLYIISGYDNQEITRFSINDGTITAEASGKVKGHVKDQFSMSEYNGYFRIATTENVWEESIVNAGDDSNTVSTSMTYLNNHLYVLDMNMNEVGIISEFGKNEEIKSVNFSGDTAYVVTFMKTDPLYAIDLSNPEKPEMLDEFKISGYSSYMQKWGDGLLLGFGAEAEEEHGTTTGVKMTMYDNSDPNNLKALDTVSMFDCWSEGIDERKALYIDPERNIIGFPLEKRTYSGTYNETMTYDYSYNFYSFENGKFVFKGLAENTGVYNRNCVLCIRNQPFRRAVYVDGYLYAISVENFVSLDAKSFEEINRENFGQYHG